MKFYHFYDPDLLFSFHLSRFFPLPLSSPATSTIDVDYTVTRHETKSVVCLAQRSSTKRLTASHILPRSSVCLTHQKFLSKDPDTSQLDLKLVNGVPFLNQGQMAPDCLSPHTDAITKICPKRCPVKHCICEEIVDLRHATLSSESSFRNPCKLKL